MGGGVDQGRTRRGTRRQQPASADSGDAELIVATIFDQITAALAAAGVSNCVGFGAFTVKQRPARIGHNPRTHETVQVDEKTVPRFKTSREMLRRLNGSSQPASGDPT